MGHIFSAPHFHRRPPVAVAPVDCVSGVEAIRQRAASLQEAERPVAALAADYISGSVSNRHSHQRTQLLHALTGVMTVITEEGSWVVPPQHALWIPAGVIHQSRCWGDVQVRSLYIEPAAVAGLPHSCCVIQVSPLLRALINEVMTFSVDYDMEGREGQIVQLILGEIGRMPEMPLHGVMPRDRRLVRICEAVLRDPSCDHCLDHWARVGGLGRRTLTRLFRQETGMSFVEWRQQVRLMEALARLAAGEPVTTVALDLGYDSPSAFSAMFRKTLGMSPKDYLKWGEPDSQ